MIRSNKSNGFSVIELAVTLALLSVFIAVGVPSFAGIWKIPMLTDNFQQTKQYALVVWVSDMDDIAPIQSTGYWLPEEWFN